MSHRLHPLTVLRRGGSRGLGFAALGFFAGGSVGGVLDLPGGPTTPVVLGALGIVIGIAYEFARVSRFEYELSPDTLDIHSGVFARREREIPLRRVQNVDVTRDVVSRVLGLAVVEIETAGGGGTEATFRYLGIDAARELQEGIRTRKRQVEDGAEPTAVEPTSETPPGSIGGEPTVAAPDRDVERELLFELDGSDLLLVSALSFDLRALSLLLFVGPLAAPVVGMVANGFDAVAGALLAIVVAGAAVAAIAVLWLVSAARTFVRFYGFRLTQRGDELRYERGLLQRDDGSIPLDQGQTLTVEENVLMRRFGYASLAVDTAGYAPGTAPSGGSEAAVPLAPRDSVFALARRLEGAVEPTFERPPESARRRYAVRYALGAVALTAVAFAVDAFLSPVPWYVPLLFLLLAPVAASAKWRHRGRAVADDHVLTRNGFWQRRIQIVPYYRVQTLIEHRTIFQRRWGLSTVVVDTAGTSGLIGGDAAAVDVAAADGETFRRAVFDRFLRALSERRGGPETGRIEMGSDGRQDEEPVGGD